MCAGPPESRARHPEGLQGPQGEGESAPGKLLEALVAGVGALVAARRWREEMLEVLLGRVLAVTVLANAMPVWSLFHIGPTLRM